MQKQESCSNVATLQRAAETQHPDVAMFPNNVATFGVCFGSIFDPFEPRIEGFKAQTSRKQKEVAKARRRGLCPHFVDQRGGWELFLKILEKIMRFVEENPRIIIILIIKVFSFSFLMFYPKFMMYQTSIMF